MHKPFSVVGVVAATLLALGAPLSASAAPRTQVATGDDVSWPQCGRSLPSTASFGIVGVNGGLANNSNTCFDSEWQWAQKRSGTAGQPAASVYVDTANPELAGSWWPTSNKAENDPTPVTVPSRYDLGTCDGTASAACAYVYGWSKAYDDVHRRGVADPHVRWWLDVETDNSWSTSNLEANRADLEAMTTVFTNAGGSVGVYSTRYQYSQIVGTVSSGPLYGLDSWLAGGGSAKGAQSLCSSMPLAGGRVTLAQYVSGALDYDVSCIG